MKHKWLLVPGLILLLTRSAGSVAGSNPYGIDDALDRAIRSGLHELYNLNFDEAKKIFDSIKEKEAEHPLVAFGAATVAWWRISVNVTENDDAASEPFVDAATHCLKISLTKIKSGDTTGEAYLTLGSTYALLARWEAANQNWLAVYRRAKKSRVFLNRALKLNPDALDANMALGIFDYTLSTLPKIARVFSGTRADDNPEKGLRELTVAAEQGIYLRLPATFLLSSIYSEDLKDPAKSVEILSRLSDEYPASPFVHLMLFTALYNENCPVDMSREAEDFEANVNAGVYRPEFVPQAMFLRALVHFKAREWREAEIFFGRAAQSADEINPYKVWATLYKGYAQDAKGNREEAVKSYRAVLKERARWKSHEYAAKRLRRPFADTDPELDTLLL